jgi:hypothetical protein
MSQSFEIRVPKELSAIPLKNYQKYIKDVKSDPNKQQTKEELEFANLKVLECFCNITMKQAYKLPMTDFTDIIKHISDLFAEKTPLQRTFTMTDKNGDTIEFGFIPKLDDISMGEFIDLDKYISDWQQMHKAMAVLYRPLKHKDGDLYLINDYEGTDKLSEIMLDAPVNVAMGAMLFFYHLGNELSKHLIVSLEKQLKVDSEFQQILEQSGVGINQFTHSLEEMSANLKKLQSYHYFNA